MPQPARMLGPLLSAALDNALRLGDAALTGPVARGDAETVAGHVEALRGRRARGAARLPGAGAADRHRALASGMLTAPDAQRLLDVLARRAGDRDAEARPSRPAPSVPMLIRTRKGLAAARAALPGPVVLVPTMGALHDGHRSPLRLARELAGPDGSVLVSIFVNPLQFGPAEDFDRYPRPLEQDLALCGEEGVSAVFASGPARRSIRPSRR